MKALRKASLLAFLLANTTLFAYEPSMGLYAGLILGLSTTPNQSITFTKTGLGSFTGTMAYNVLMNGGAQVGTRCNKFRFEAEGVYNTNSVHSVHGDGLTVSIKKVRSGISTGAKSRGNTAFIAGLGNLYLELYNEDDPDTKWVPYIGIGGGVASITNTFNIYTHEGVLVSGSTRGKTKSSPIGQAMGGFSYFFSDNLSIGSDLRYMNTKNIKEFHSRLVVVTWNVILNYSFDTAY